MVRTQIQLPDELYRSAKRIADQREISLAEVVRRGLEHMVRTHPVPLDSAERWALPAARHMGQLLVPPSALRELANETAPPVRRR